MTGCGSGRSDLLEFSLLVCTLPCLVAEFIPDGGSIVADGFADPGRKGSYKSSVVAYDRFERRRLRKDCDVLEKRFAFLMVAYCCKSIYELRR